MKDYTDRFNELIARGRQIPIKHMQGWGRYVDNEPLEEWLSNVIALVEIVFGAGSTQVERLKACETSNSNHTAVVLESCLGALRASAEQYSLGYFKTVRREISEEFVIDACLHAERLVDEGFLESGSVLAAAALEDSLRRAVEDEGESVEGKGFVDYIGVLKAKGRISSASSKIASSFRDFRNNAMHADWAKISIHDVRAVTAFVKSFVGNP